MKKCEERTEGKKTEIISAALKLFLESGYEGTSIRMIAADAGCEVGLCYYYFKNKDELFSRAMELFFEHYQKDADRIVQRGWRDPFNMMRRFWYWLLEQEQDFRDRYEDRIHWTVHWAIREQTLILLEPRVERMIEILQHYGAKLELDKRITTMYLAHGVGSMILHDGAHIMTDQKMIWEIRRGINLLMGLTPDSAELVFPNMAQLSDIPAFMGMMEQVKDSFPGFEEVQFCEMLSERIEQQEVYVIAYHSRIVGGVIFSKERKEIDFLAVAPDCRKKKLAARLLITAMGQFEAGEHVTVVTYRSGDAAGWAAREFYRRMGFIEEELVVVFDYPCARLGIDAPERWDIFN